MFARQTTMAGEAFVVRQFASCPSLARNRNQSGRQWLASSLAGPGPSQRVGREKKKKKKKRSRLWPPKQ